MWHLLHEALTETSTVQPIMSLYPLPMSMLSQGGVDYNTNVLAIPLPSKTTGLNEKKTPKPMITKKSYMQASKANISLSIEDVI